MLTIGHRGVGGELREHRVGPGAHTHRGDVPGEHQRGVARGLPSRELQLVGAQHHGVAAQLVDADLEGETGAGGGVLEDQRHAAPGEHLRGERRGLQLGGAGEQSVELGGAQLGSREIVAGGGRLSGVARLGVAEGGGVRRRRLGKRHGSASLG